MLLFCCFIKSHTIVFVFRLNEYKKSLFDFIRLTAGIFVYKNYFANAILFVMTNVKARKFLRNFRQLWEGGW